MNHEAISQIGISETFTVQPEQTARAVYAKLPFGAAYAARLADVLCTVELLAQLESICAAALHPCVTWPGERVLGASFTLRHQGPARVGDVVAVRGFVQTLGDREVVFSVEGHVADRCVVDATLRFVVVPVREATRPAIHPAVASPVWTLA